MAQEVCTDILDVGVDWLTITSTGPWRVSRLDKLALSTFDKESASGFREHSWGMSGFTGWVCGGLQYGSRGQERIARLSGPIAQTHWRHFYALAKSVTRLDYQCTTRSADLAARRIARAHTTGLRWTTETRNRCGVTYITNSDGGSTCYFGRRTSNLYGRIYDKGVESGLPQWSNCVRHELELKQDHATEHARRLYLSKDEDRLIIGSLQHYFSNHGADPHLTSAAMNILVQCERVSDDEKSLQWLSSSVRPTVLRLLAAGRESEVLSSLGLDPN